MLRWTWVNSSAGASYTLDDSRARACYACSRCGRGLFGRFYSHPSFFTYFALSLGYVVVVLLFYFHRKHLRSRQDGQLS